MTDLDLTTLVKWTQAGGLPTHGKGRWVAGKPRSVRGVLIPCERGIHAVTVAQSIPWLSDECRLFTPVGDERIDEPDKTVFRAGIVSEPLATWDETTARLFAADCAERVLHLFESRYPDDRRPREAIEVARRFARGEATRDEGAAAWAAARAAARAAAWAAARAAETDWQVARLLAYLRGEAT